MSFWQTFSSRTPLLQNYMVQIDEPEQEKKGFIFGDAAQNKKHAQEIMDEANSDRLLVYRLKTVMKDTAVELATTGATLASLYFGTRKLMGNDSATSQLVILNGYTTAVTKLIKPFKDVGKAIVHAPKGKELAAATMKTAITRVKNEVDPMLDQLPTEIAEGVEKSIDDLLKVVKHVEPDAAFNKTPEFLAKSYKLVIEQLSYPYLTQNTYQHDLQGNPQEASIIDAQQEALTKLFPEAIREDLNDVMNKHRLASIGDTTLQPFHIFEGPPAVGKTYVVRQMAKVLNAVLIEGNENDLADFLDVPRRDGKRLEEAFDTDLWLWRKVEGKIWKNIKEKTSNGNFILFFDELSFENNPYILPAFKAWMTGTERFIPNTPDLTIDNKFTIIAASNENIYEQLKDDAAKSRISTHIKFSHWKFDELEQRVDEYVKILAQERLESKSPLTARKTHDDLSIIVKPLMEEVGRYPEGAFSLRDLHSYLDLVANRLQIANDKGQEYNLAEYPKKIEEHFKRLLTRRGSGVKKNPPKLGGIKYTEDVSHNVLFLEALEKRTSEAAKKASASGSDTKVHKAGSIDAALSSKCVEHFAILHPKVQDTIIAFSRLSDSEIKEKYETEFLADLGSASKKIHSYYVKQGEGYKYFLEADHSRIPKVFMVSDHADYALKCAAKIGMTFSAMYHAKSLSANGKGKAIVV